MSAQPAADRQGGAAGVVFALLGPTGVGKTAVASELARLVGIRVVSCDSMQIYRDFPVLTNQPTEAETEGVLHELVGVLDPGCSFSAAEYADLARPLIEQDLAGAGHALVAGGTGLYMRAALAPLAVAAAADLRMRARLEERAAAEGAGALHAQLAGLDPEAAKAIDPRNVRRVVRALEALLVGGSAWSGRQDLWAPDYFHPTVVIGLVTERSKLYRRIECRAEQIVDGGAVDEVRRFREERGREATAPGGPGILTAIGYPEICRYLDGGQTRVETVQQIAAATRRYARRQLTWLRKLEGAVMIDVDDREPCAVAAEIGELRPGGRPGKEIHRG